MFLFPELSIKDENTASITEGLSKLNNLLIAIDLDLNPQRKVFYEYLTSLPLGDRLLSLGDETVGIQPFLSQQDENNRKIAMQGLEAIADKFSSCSHLIALPLQHIYILTNQTAAILANIETALESDVILDFTINELREIGNKLIIFRDELISAIKIYLDENKNDSELDKDLLYHFSIQVDSALEPLRDLRAARQPSPKKRQVVDIKLESIHEHFIQGNLNIPIDNPPDNNFKQKLIECVYYCGTDNDREYLYHNGYAKKGGIETLGQFISQTTQAVVELPQEVADRFTAWQRQREIDTNTVEKAKYQLINHVSAYDDKNHDRYGNKNRIVSVDDDNDDDDVDDKISVGKQKRKPFVKAKSFSEFYTVLESFKNDEGLNSVDALLAENMGILRALCGRMQDARDNHFYSADELTLLSETNRLREECRSNKNASLDDINALKEGLKVKVKHKKYCAAAEEFNAPGDKNIFYVLKNHDANRDDENKIIALSKIEEMWKRRSKFSIIPSSSLLELQDNIEKLQQYIIMLTNDFGLENENDQMPASQKQMAKDLVDNLDELLEQERHALAQAMLERLALVPRADLLKLSSSEYIDENATYCDDLIFATLQSLVPFGLTADYVDRFIQQAPPYQTLTETLICQFNDFINWHGSDEQKRSLQNLFVQNTEQQTDKNPNAGLPSKEGVILVPTSIVGQFYTRLDASQTGLDASFICIGNPANRSKALEESGLGMSFIAADNHQRIYIPLGLHLTEIAYTDDKLGHFYDLVKPDYTTEVVAIKDFAFVLSSHDSDYIDKLANNYFNNKNNQHYFVETVKSIMRDDHLNISDACKRAYNDTTSIIIFAEAKETFQNLNLEDCKYRFIHFAKALSKKIARIHSNSPNLILPFENEVIEPAFDLAYRIENQARKLHSEMHEAGASRAHCEKVSEHFAEMACFYLVENNFADVEAAFSEAEMDALILSHSESVPDDFRDEFKDKAKNQLLELGEENREKWVKSIDNAKYFIGAKIALRKFLQNEISRITNYRFSFLMDNDKTQSKIKFLSDQLSSIDNMKSFAVIRKFQNSLFDNEVFSQNRLKTIFCLFESISTRSITNLDKFTELHPLLKDPVKKSALRQHSIHKKAGKKKKVQFKGGANKPGNSL